MHGLSSSDLLRVISDTIGIDILVKRDATSSEES